MRDDEDNEIDKKVFCFHSLIIHLEEKDVEHT